MKEIRLHGRGGQGVVTAAEIIAAAFVAEGKYATCFPMFGFERRGAPLTAFIRFDEYPIWEKTQIYSPDCVIVTDPALGSSATILAGLRPGGILVVNSPKPPSTTLDQNLRLVGVVDGTEIALQEIGVPITNTCMVGAFASTTRWLALDSVLASLRDYFKGDVLKRNIRCVERGFHEVRNMELRG